MKGFFFGGVREGGELVQTAFARLAVLKCILLGPSQRSEARVVGNVCVLAVNCI